MCWINEKDGHRLEEKAEGRWKVCSTFLKTNKVREKQRIKTTKHKILEGRIKSPALSPTSSSKTGKTPYTEYLLSKHWCI